MACPACGCLVHYQYDNGWDGEQQDERLECCAACGEVFDIEDAAEWREEEEVPAPPPDPAEAFLHTLQAFDQYLRDVLKGAADAIVQALGQVVSTFIASKALRDLKRAWNPYHRAKFHRHPKRRALRK